MKSPIVTNKQKEIPYLLYRFRFLNRTQIQTMLNHKTFNRINVWLNDLTEKGILNRTYSKKFGENTKPAIYYLGKASIEILKGRDGVNEKLLKRIYSEKSRSQYFREWSMFLADIFLSLKSQSKGEFHFFTKTELEDYSYLPNPHPDAYIALKEGKETKRYFLEVISEQVPRFVLRKRIEHLFQYYTSGTWQKGTKHPFPAILMICPSYVTKGFLSKFISQTRGYEEDEVAFYLTTQDVIKAAGMKPGIWQKVE